MKLVKTLSAIAAVAILSACSNATANVEEKAVEAVAPITELTQIGRASCRERV